MGNCVHAGDPAHDPRHPPPGPQQQAPPPPQPPLQRPPPPANLPQQIQPQLIWMMQGVHQHQQTHQLPPEVSDIRTIRNHINVNKASLRMTPQGGEDLYVMEFQCDTDEECTVSFFQCCVEQGEKEGRMHFKPLVSALQLQPFRPIKIPAGPGVKVTTPAPINLSMIPAKHQQFDTANPTQIPLVIQLECHPAECPDARGLPQYQYNYVSFDPSTKAPRIVMQKIQVANEVFMMEDIYGATNDETDGPTTGAVVGTVDTEGETPVEDNTCVVCLTEARTTLVMPCRHQCLCGECANMLRLKQNKCPVCRTTIESLIKAAG